MNIHLTIKKKPTKSPKKIRYYFAFTNVKKSECIIMDGKDYLDFNLTSNKGIHVNGFLQIKDDNPPLSPKRGKQKIYCDNKYFRVNYNNQGYDIYIYCDSYKQLEYIKGTIKCPKNIVTEQNFENHYVLINIKFTITREDFLSYFKNVKKYPTGTRYLKLKNAIYKVYNPKPYRGGGFCPK